MWRLLAESGSFGADGLLDLKNSKNNLARRSARQAETRQSALTDPPGTASLRLCANISSLKSKDPANAKSNRIRMRYTDRSVGATALLFASGERGLGGGDHL